MNTMQSWTVVFSRRGFAMMLLGIVTMGVTAGMAAGQARKPVGLLAENPHYFVFRDKPTILVGSTEHYGAVLNLDFDYIAYLDELERHGLNQTRTFSGTYREIPESFGITDNTLAPKPDRFICPWPQKDGKFDLSQFDEGYFKRLKDFVAQAGKRGVVVEYVLFCTLYDDKLWDASPMNPKNHSSEVGTVGRQEVFTLKHAKLVALQEAFVRKAVAELKEFDNVYYEIINEPYFAGPSDEWQARIAAVIAKTEKDYPHRHLIAQNIANDRKKVEKVTPHVSILNFHYATPPETVEMNYRHNLPIADDETGFRGKEDVHYRTEAWDFFVAGGAGYNHLDYSFTPKHPAGTLTDYKSPGGGSLALRQQLSILKKLFGTLDLRRLKPANEIIRGGTGQVAIGAKEPGKSKTDSARSGALTVRAIADEGNTYTVYVRNGTQATLSLQLPAGKYEMHWLNTQSGAMEDKSAFEHGGGERSFISPTYAQDIVLQIVRVR